MLALVRWRQAADVPIVKLNPLNILTVKAEGEKELRAVSMFVWHKQSG